MRWNRENNAVGIMHQGQLHSFLRTQCLTITIFNDDAACPVKTWKVNDTAFYQPLTPYLNQIEAWITCLKMIRASPCKVLSTRRKRMSSMAAKQKWLTCQPTALYVSHTTWLTIPRSEEHRIIWEHRMFWKGLHFYQRGPSTRVNPAWRTHESPIVRVPRQSSFEKRSLQIVAFTDVAQG